LNNKIKKNLIFDCSENIIYTAFLRGLGKAPTFLVPIINPPFADNSPQIFYEKKNYSTETVFDFNQVLYYQSLIVNFPSINERNHSNRGKRNLISQTKNNLRLESPAPDL